MTALAGTGLLLRQALRRDRWLAAAWTGVLVLMTFASAFATTSLYGSSAREATAARLIDSQAGLVALYGPVQAAGGAGALAMSKMTVLYAFFAAALFVVLVRRHTRIEEESGRADVVGAACTGRNAPIAAAIAEGWLVALALASLCATADLVAGLGQQGSLLFGASWLGTGLVATGVAALACQVATSARTCGALALAGLAAAYVVRALGDATAAHWLGWLSPFGWNTRLQAWSDPRPWVLGLYVVLTAALVTVAQALRSRRDLGAGVIGTRAGRAAGQRWVRGAIGLVARLHLGACLLWGLAILVVTAIFGALVPGLGGVLAGAGGRHLVADLGGSLEVAILTEVAVAVSCFAVTILVQAAHDEISGRLDVLLAAPESRRAWIVATVVVAAGSSLVLTVLAGVGTSFGYGLAGGPHPAQAVGAALVWLPAILLVVTLTGLCLAIDPRLAALGWAWPFGFLALSLVPPLLGAPRWVSRLSPFAHVPKVPEASMSWTPMLALLALAAVAFLAALRRFEVRDLG